MNTQPAQPVLTIKMVPAGVNVVLNALARMPYAEVVGLIKEIQQQAQAQLAEQTQTDPQPQPEGETE